MKFALAFYGTRGDIEPGIAIGRELLRRGHEVRIAVAPDLVAFAESAGLAAVAYGLDTQTMMETYREYWTHAFGDAWRIKDRVRLWRAISKLSAECRKRIATTLPPLADGVDLLLTGLSFERAAPNVAEHYDIPLATMHYVPFRPNAQQLPFLPASLARSAMVLDEWLAWRTEKKFDDAQRRELGLPKATAPVPRRMRQRGSLEIQAYDEVCFPGLAAEWADFDGRRPFVGALTMESPTDFDEEVASWIAEGPPPIFFGFGSMPVKCPADTVAMIGSACEQLGERALVCAGWSDFSDIPRFPHVKVVGAMNYAALFPACRAVVHHGGAGTTAVGLRAGVPTLILSMDYGQTCWGAQVKGLKVGTTRRFSKTDEKSLVEDLRQILAPPYVARAREIATRMTSPHESVAAAADLVETFVSERAR